MEKRLVILWGALLVANLVSGGILGWQWQRWRKEPKLASLFARWFVAWLLSTLLSLATLPTQPPFQPGQALGMGILTGFLGASLTLWLFFLHCRIWLSFVGVFLPFLLPLLAFPGYPLPSLLGVLTSFVIIWFCVGEQWQPFALAAFSFAVSIGLARYYEPPQGVSKHLWQALPAWLSLAGWLGKGVVEGWQHYWRTSVKGVVPLVMAVPLLLGAGVLSHWSADGRFFVLTLFACFAAWLAHRWETSALKEFVPLIWVGLFTLSFATLPVSDGVRLLSGYGVAIAAIVLAWMAIGQGETDSALWQGASLLVAFAFFRWFAETYPLRTPRADLYTHYTFVGFLLGISLPSLFARWLQSSSTLFSALLTGFWAAVTPVALGALWGVKAAAGYMGGSIAASLWASPSPTLFAGFVAALPLVAVVEPASDLPRRVRLGILVGVTLFALLSGLMGEWGKRFARGRLPP
ncbi:MAG: hypothetical protein C4295_00325 [Candidatus Fervidibacterota bacterium]